MQRSWPVLWLKSNSFNIFKIFNTYKVMVILLCSWHQLLEKNICRCQNIDCRKSWNPQNPGASVLVTFAVYIISTSTSLRNYLSKGTVAKFGKQHCLPVSADVLFPPTFTHAVYGLMRALADNKQKYVNYPLWTF